MHIFCGLTPAGNFSNLLGKVLKFMQEIRQGPLCALNNKISTTCKGAISRMKKMHFVHSTKCPYVLLMQFYLSLVWVLLKIWWTMNIKKTSLLKKGRISLGKKWWNKMMANILGSMLFASLNSFFSLKHGCEQQI